MSKHEFIYRISNYLKEYEDKKNPNDARKIGECICKLILINSTNEKNIELANEEKFNILIESLNKRILEDIDDGHLKKIKLDLRTLQEFGNIGSHDNHTTITPHDNDSINRSIKNLIINTFGAKEYLDIDHQVPSNIYKYISKNTTENQNWKCLEIISSVYPNRKIEKISNSRKFEFYTLIDVNQVEMGFVFLGRNISFSNSFKELFENHGEKIEKLISISILFPKEISKATGSEVKNRCEHIKSKCLEYEKNTKAIKFTYHFIEDYIWENCLPENLKHESEVTVEPYFIDQFLYEKNKEILSLEFIDKLISNSLEDNKPIHIIIGDGGVGKTTFCEQALQKIDQFLLNGGRKKALLLSSFDLPDNLNEINRKINSIQELYCILQNNNETNLTEKHLALNISSGNILIIIDGLDEIESKLKDQFNLNDFIKSVIDLNDTYQNCSVLITSRNNNLEEFNREDINIYQLKGFNKELTTKYLERRYNNSSYIDKDYDRAVSKHIKNMNLISTNGDENLSPLIIRLLCDFVESGEKNEEYKTTEKYKYFIISEHLDKVINQIIMRDIQKQGVEISPDDYFEILKEIVIDYNGSISKKDLDEILNYYFSNTNSRNSDDYTNFYVSPLLSRQRDFFKIKYDSLEFWIKSRFFISEIDENKKNTPLTKALEVILKECYKGGALVSDIKKHHSNIDPTDFLKNLIALSIKNIKATHNEKEIIQNRKLISGVCYLSIPNSNSTQKDQRTQNLLKIFNAEDKKQLDYLSIFGEFYPIDFSEITISHGYFDNYTNLSKSKFPKQRTIFKNSTFINIDTSKFNKDDLQPSSFADCRLSNDLEKMIMSCDISLTEKDNFIKSDLKKIFKVGFNQNSFSWKSESLYKQMCSSMKYKIKLSQYLELLVSNGFLIKENNKDASGVGYKLNKDLHGPDVKDFITQGLISNKIEKLIKILHDM